jgi:hypothetical protein
VSLVTALFYDSNDMERAIEALIARGIAPGDLSLMVSRTTAGRYFMPGSSQAGDDDEIDGPLAVMAANLVAASSGNAAVLATGPMMTALVALGTHARIGGIAAGLCSLGIGEHEAAFCEHSIRNCDALLLGVTTNERPDGIKAYLRWFDIAGARNSLAAAN